MSPPRRLTAHRGVGALLLVLGAGSLVEAFAIKDDWAGAKLMPVVAAVALLAVGAAHVAVRPRAASGAPGIEGDTTARGLSRVGIVVAMLVVYVAALPTLGFLAATMTLLLVLVRRLGGYRWPAAIGLAIALGAACHVVFRVWLGMPLPEGALPF